MRWDQQHWRYQHVIKHLVLDAAISYLCRLPISFLILCKLSSWTFLNCLDSLLFSAFFARAAPRLAPLTGGMPISTWAPRCWCRPTDGSRTPETSPPRRDSRVSAANIVSDVIIHLLPKPTLCRCLVVQVVRSLVSGVTITHALTHISTTYRLPLCPPHSSPRRLLQVVPLPHHHELLQDLPYGTQSRQSHRAHQEEGTHYFWPFSSFRLLLSCKYCLLYCHFSAFSCVRWMRMPTVH